MMRTTIDSFLLAVILTLALPLGTVQGAEAEPTPAKATDSAELDGPALFEQLKSLVGEWQGSWDPGNIETVVTYRLTGNGSVLVEDYVLGDPSDATTMSTLYHLDGDQLMLTHYCSIGNQPRMRATEVSADGREIIFDQFDITNLGETGYSEQLTLTLSDRDHIVLSFRGSRTGSSSGVQLERVRKGG